MAKGSSPTMDSITRHENPIGAHGVDSTGETIQYECHTIWVEYGLENFNMYNKGGYHPVILDDILDDRFHVVHKLGSGGFGTVWLCRDLHLNKWRAVKIIAANYSSGTTEEKIFKYLRENCTLEELEENHIVVPLEEFYIEGPNGRHRCLVMPLLGFTVSDWRMTQKGFEEQTGIDAKNICRQIAEALNFLHGHGICHGDYRPKNILLKVEGFDELNEDQIIELMGEPDCIRIDAAEGQSLAPRAPEYGVMPAFMDPKMDWFKTRCTMSVAVIDFGESFFVKDPPVTTGIPCLWAAPEVMFEGSRTLGLPSEIWSLACTLFEVRTGKPLLGSFEGGLLGTVKEIEFLLGPQKQPEPESECREILTDPQSAKRNEFIKETGYSDIFEATVGHERFAHDMATSQDTTYRYPRNEVIELADLLRNMMKYEPDERIEISAVLSHPWLRTESPQTIHANSVHKGIYGKLLIVISIALVFATITCVMDQLSDVKVIDGQKPKPEELSQPLRQLALHLNPGIIS